MSTIQSSLLRGSRTFLLLAMLVAAAATAHAQDTPLLQGNEADGIATGPRHSLSVCPGGIAFGIFSANYEYLFDDHHGLVARFDYEAVPGTYSDAALESSGFAVVFNYRWHLDPSMESLYIGAYSRFRRFSGSGAIDGTSFDFAIPDVTVGLNVGKKWVWSSGFSLNFALGYGVMSVGRETSIDSPAVDAALDTFEKEYDFISPFLGELSIGYAF